MAKKNKRKEQLPPQSESTYTDETYAAQLGSQPEPQHQEPAAPKFEFDVWWALREKQLPAHHSKEIIKADFKGRGLRANATLAEFDAALNSYGIKL